MRRTTLSLVLLAALSVGCRRNTALGSGTSSASGAGAGASSGSNSSASSSAGSGSGSGTGSGSGGASSGSSGASGSSGGGCTQALSAIQLSPASSNVTLSGGTAAPITFTVQGVAASGNVTVDPAQLTWSATRGDDTDPGSIAAGVYQPNPLAGGVVTITAQGCGATGTATVNFTLSYQPPAQVADGGVPVGPGDFTGSAGTGATHLPKIVYPSDQTRFPRNIYKVLFQWQKSGNSRFRLTFTGPGSTVQVYTDGSHPQCASVNGLGCWEADHDTWQAIAGSNAGSTVTLQVDGTTSAGSAVYSSTQETLGFSKRDVKGAIFYWAADVGGVQRATVSDAAPENYLVGPQLVPPTPLPNGDTVKCAACHTVSRDGTKLAVSGSADGPVAMNKGLWVFDVTPHSPPSPTQTHFPDAMADGFAAFSPDDTKLVWSPRNGGQLVLVDAASGNTISKVTVGGAAVNGHAPDWSPRAVTNDLVYADTAGNISRTTWDGASYSAPQVLAAKLAGHNNDYPSYSPEGDWVAFTNNAKSLYLVEADGGTPVALAAANTVVNNAVVAPSENSMPTWAPPGDLHWIAFNSQRAYGQVTTGGNNQIWVAAVDLSRAGTGDPSYPAFRLPFQELSAKNHRAFWTLDVRDYPDGGYYSPDAGSGVDKDAGYVYDAGGCVATGDACNPDGLSCCDQDTTGAFCSSIPDGGGPVCQVIPFR